MRVEVGIGQAMLGQVMSVLSCLAVPRVRGKPQERSRGHSGPQFPCSVTEEQSLRAVSMSEGPHLLFFFLSVLTCTLSKTFSLISNIQTLKMSQN